jgi:hypothetical protein
MATIYDTQDNAVITDGLQGCAVSDEAIDAARRIAAERGTDVLLVDDDGDWIVHPDDRPASPGPVARRNAIADDLAETSARLDAGNPTLSTDGYGVEPGEYRDRLLARRERLLRALREADADLDS